MLAAEDTSTDAGAPLHARVERLAAVTAGATFLLLLLGGLVHNTRSSLACPDWPLCYGQVFPPMRGGILVEHSHRLLASTVGLLTLVLLGLALHAGRVSARWRQAKLAGAAFALVVAQGVLGGLTVLLRLPTWTSTAHLAVSLLFFCVLIYLARGESPSAGVSRGLRRVAAGVLGLAYAQILLGALIRHLGAGLACIEVPLCQGSAWPANATIFMQLHMLHRWLGVVVFVAVVVVAGRARRELGAARLASLVPVLVIAQVALGLLSITTFLDVWIVTAHLGVAAAILAALFWLAIGARAAAPARAVAESRALPMRVETA